MFIKNFNKYALLTAAAFLGPEASAVEVDYSWTFLSGQPWPGGYNQNTGKPNNLIYARNEYPADFFERINNALPEREVNEAFLTDDAGSTISLSEEAEVFVTFIHEGAGYKNSFGYFTFDASNPPQSIYDVQETIVFPNLSYPHLTNGHRLSIGTFPAGTNIGFFIAANGFWWYTGVKNWSIPYYYSLSGLNNEPTEELKQHVVLLYDEEVAEVILGFEDLPRSWGDNDFNDAVFSVKATPNTAIVSENLVSIPEVNDSDADGVPDESDEFPNDYRRAYSSYYPSAGDWVTLAFEDNWPKLGDYDMNDLVVRERMRTIYSADGGISGLQISGFIDARGGSKANGFALRLMNTANNLLKDASITIDGTVFPKVAENFQTNTVIQLWSNTKLLTQTGESGSCSHFNTVKSCTKFSPVPFTLDMTFNYDLDNLPHSDLDFFIFRTNKRGHEIHFANYPPTDLFDEFLFGKHADRSNPSQSKYFKSNVNLPWALKLNSNWDYPREYIDVLWAYPGYETWVESNGQAEQDWYQSTYRTTHIYKK